MYTCQLAKEITNKKNKKYALGFLVSSVPINEFEIITNSNNKYYCPITLEQTQKT